MVSRQQHLWNVVPTKRWRSGVAWRAEPALVKGVAARAVEIGHRAGQQPDGCIDDRQGGGLAATQHEVSERDLFGCQMFGDSLVDVLVVPAEQREGLTAGVAHCVS